MRGRVFLVVVMAVMVLALPMVAAAAPPSKPLLGAWWSIDVDGSFQKMSLAGGNGGIYKLQYRDDAATACNLGVPGPILYAATGKGQGWFDGATLVTEMVVWCHAKPPFLWADSYTSTLEYQSPDTLREWVTWSGGSQWVIWKRMSDK